MSLAMREMLGVVLECSAHPKYDSELFWSPSFFFAFEAYILTSSSAILPACTPSEAPKKSRGVSSHPRRSLAAPPSVRQNGAPSDAPGASSTVSMLHTTTTTARVIRYNRALPFLPPHGLDTTPARTQAPTALPAARAARDVGVPRRLPAHRDSSAVYCRHRPTPASAVLPSTTFIASCVRSACDRRSPSPAPLLSPPRVPNAFPASTTLPDPHARRALARTTPRVPSTCSSRSPSPAPRLSPPCPPLPCPAPDYPQLVSGTGSMTRSIAGARSKYNERSPSPTPPSSPPRAPRLSSAPTPATARNLGLPRTANRTGTISRAQHTLQLSPIAPYPPRFHVHPQPYTAPLVDDSARRLRLPR
ncbi:hypothetical protein DFH08DRAFT_985105 [Mycena albidolilacea]|uniref:Uncharacterized protein n=1 Tax=Mycena albidolilacea TaxID=1033008 RepID=A0AAD7AD31_9AGAR|nr:hypothetical protein DFH08DRAFT_985105 [Mycena albidolilacea]